jgi:hypothetical protein
MPTHPTSRKRSTPATDLPVLIPIRLILKRQRGKKPTPKYSLKQKTTSRSTKFPFAAHNGAPEHLDEFNIQVAKVKTTQQSRIIAATADEMISDSTWGITTTMSPAAFNGIEFH